MHPSRVERDLGSGWRLVPCLHSGEASYPSHSRACLRCPCLRHLRSAPVENAPPRRVSWGPRRCRSSASRELAGLPHSYPMGRGRAGKCWPLSAPAHPARSDRLWAGLGAPRRRSDPPRGSPGEGIGRLRELFPALAGGGGRLRRLKAPPVAPASTGGRAGHAGCRSPEPRAGGAGLPTAARAGGAGSGLPLPAGPRVHAGCAALPLYWVGVARVGLVGRWEPRVPGPTCVGQGQGLGRGLPAPQCLSVSV